MFCPKCRDEFVEGILECVDCKVPLVESLPEGEKLRTQPEYVELVTVLSTMNMSDLLVAKSILESAGIRCFAKGVAIKSLYGIMEPMQLQVPAEDAELAKELLQTDQQD